jgi:hypothetical protein
MIPPVEHEREEISCEEKTDKVVEQLEELILDALIVALEKMRRRNKISCELLYRSKLIV